MNSKALSKLRDTLRPIVVLSIAISTTACPIELGEDCITDTSPAYNRTYTCHSIDFNVSIPDECQSGNCGLIVDVHGLTMNAEVENAGTKMRHLGRNAVKRGAQTPYIVIQPNANGLVPSWSEADDKPIYEFMQEAVDAWDIDENRIHFGGFSQGGDMSYRFMCKYSDFVASFAPMGGGDFAGCAVSKNPILHIHGYLDPLASFADEATANRDAYLSIMGGYHSATIDEGWFHTHTRYSGNGFQYDLIAHDSLGAIGGHCIPGGLGPFGCPASFHAGKTIIDFYIAHPKKAERSLTP